MAILTSLWMTHAQAAEGEGGAAAAVAQDLAPVFPEKMKKGKWDPKGKAIEPFLKGDAKRKQEAWGEAIPLLVEAATLQPGCGKCLNSLASTLDGAERYEDAVAVGELMLKYYPDRSEGWARISDAWQDADELEKAIEASTNFLSIMKDDTTHWWRRNSNLIALGRVDEASTLLKGAGDAGVSNDVVKCLETQNLAAQGKVVEARDVYPICDESKDLTLKRVTEGWLLLAEGTNLDLAVTRLSLGGESTHVRLIQAYVRLDQKRYDLADNLALKALSESSWALDAHLAHAEALWGLGKPTEALGVLDQYFMGEGWAERNAKLTTSQVLLRMRGTSWPSQVAQRAAVLKVTILAGQGDYAAAWALREEVLKAYGDAQDLQNSLQSAINTPAGNTGIGRSQIHKALATSTVVQKCQDKEKRRNASLSGSVVVTFTLGADGRVSDVKPKARTVTVPELEKCTLTELGKMRFEVAEGAQPAQIVFPVVYPL